MSVYMQQINEMVERLPENEQKVIVEFIKEKLKALRNAEYLAMLDESVAQIERGEVVEYTMEELRSLIYEE